MNRPYRDWRTAAFAESKKRGRINYHGRTLRTPTHRYTEWAPLEGNGRTLTELYDLVDDPSEFHNLAGTPQLATLAALLSERLNSMQALASGAAEITQAALKILILNGSACWARTRRTTAGVRTLINSRTRIQYRDYILEMAPPAGLEPATR